MVAILHLARGDVEQSLGKIPSVGIILHVFLKQGRVGHVVGEYGLCPLEGKLLDFGGVYLGSLGDGPQKLRILLQAAMGRIISAEVVVGKRCLLACGPFRDYLAVGSERVVVVFCLHVGNGEIQHPFPGLRRLFMRGAKLLKRFHGFFGLAESGIGLPLLQKGVGEPL